MKKKHILSVNYNKREKILYHILTVDKNNNQIIIQI